MWEISKFICLHMNITLFQQHLLKRPSSLHWIFLAPFLKINWPYSYGYVSGMCFLVPLLSIYPVPVLHSLDYHSFIVNLEINVSPPAFVFFFPQSSNYSRFFAFPYTFYNILSTMKNFARILIRTVVNLFINLLIFLVL